MVACIFHFAGGYHKFHAGGRDQGEPPDVAKLNEQTKTSAITETMAASQSHFVSVMCL